MRPYNYLFFLIFNNWFFLKSNYYKKDIYAQKHTFARINYIYKGNICGMAQSLF